MQSNALRNSMIVILLVIVGLIGYFLFSTPRSVPPSQEATTTPVSTDLTQGISVSSKSLDEKDVDKKYEITAQYPQIAGMKDAGVQSKINADITSLITSEIDGFKEGENDTTVEPGMPDGTSTIDIRYSQVAPPANVNIISFMIAEEYYSIGAAHPGHTKISLTYDLSSGKRLALSDVLTGDYVNVLSAKSIASLQASLGSDANQEFIKDGAGPKEDNFKVFLPTSTGFQVTFNEYQVAAYVNGPQDVVIPYSELKSVINPNGPLKGL